ALGAGACPAIPGSKVSSRMSAAEVRIRRLCHARAAAVNLAHFRVLPLANTNSMVEVVLLWTLVSSTVSTLVVCWNNREFLRRSLESVPAGSELIVLDNASTDGSADLVVSSFPSARLIRLSQNTGFAAGVNQAAAVATGDYLLLLNPDAEATPQAIDRVVACLDEHPTCGAASGRMISMTEEPAQPFRPRRFPTVGSVALDLLLVSRIWPGNPVTRRAEGTDLDQSASAPVERSPSSCLMVRRRAFQDVAGMDEQFSPA